ncbi:MAG: GAF domain-containing protein [Candidatus Methanomethylicia archaeon]
MNKGELYSKCYEEIKEKVKYKESLKEKMEVVCEVLKRNIPYYFWVGFYFPKEEYLELGPSRGPPACARIAYTGVCGTAYKRREAIIVPDVDKFPGHIVCDPRSKSEISLPVFNSKGDIIAIFDVDSDELNSFDEIDAEWLKKILSEVFSKQ